MMARLADMYMSTPTADVSGELRALRGEESKQKKMNFDMANSLLRDVASEAQRGRYQTSMESADDVANADKVFEREYARMLSIDPQGAAQMLSDYQRERGRRVNAEIAQAYSGASAGDEMQSLEAELSALRQSIADEEARALRSQYAAEDMQGYVPDGARGVGRAADPAAYAAQGAAEEQMANYRPLQRMYRGM